MSVSIKHSPLVSTGSLTEAPIQICKPDRLPQCQVLERLKWRLVKHHDEDVKLAVEVEVGRHDVGDCQLVWHLDRRCAFGLRLGEAEVVVVPQTHIDALPIPREHKGVNAVGTQQRSANLLLSRIV